MLFIEWSTNPLSCFLNRKITDLNKTPIDTTIDSQNPLNVALTNATVTNGGTIAATT